MLTSCNHLHGAERKLRGLARELSAQGNPTALKMANRVQSNGFQLEFLRERILWILGYEHEWLESDEGCKFRKEMLTL
jgi:hypothetical protein